MRIHLRVDRIVLLDIVVFEIADDDDSGVDVLDLAVEHDTPDTFGFAPAPDDDDGIFEDVPDEC